MGDKFTGLCEQPVLATESASSKEDISPHSTACIRKNAGRDCFWESIAATTVKWPNADSRRYLIGRVQVACARSRLANKQEGDGATVIA